MHNFQVSHSGHTVQLIPFFSFSFFLVLFSITFKHRDRYTQQTHTHTHTNLAQPQHYSKRMNIEIGGNIIFKVWFWVNIWQSSLTTDTEFLKCAFLWLLILYIYNLEIRHLFLNLKFFLILRFFQGKRYFH